MNKKSKLQELLDKRAQEEKQFKEDLQTVSQELMDLAPEGSKTYVFVLFATHENFLQNIYTNTYFNKVSGKDLEKYRWGNLDIAYSNLILLKEAWKDIVTLEIKISSTIEIRSRLVLVKENI